MITGDVLTKEKLVLKTEQPRVSEAIKAAFSGKSAYMMLPPYGNRVDVVADGTNVTFSKHPVRPFTYEEIRNIVRKVQLNASIKENIAKELLTKARKILGSRLTLFYPDASEPQIEIVFAYNWAFIGFDTESADEVFPSIRDLVQESQGSHIKVLWNNTDIVSLHNYAMDSININKKTFEGLTEVLAGANLVQESEQRELANRLTAFAAKSALYMEARQLCQNVDETFDFDKDQSFDAVVGNQKFLKVLMEILEVLAEQGGLSKLSAKQVEIMNEISADPKKLDRYNLPDSLRNLTRSTIESFGPALKQDA